MPEGIEIEMYRRAAERVVGCTIVSVDAPDPWFLKNGTEADELAAELTGATVAGTDRIGKLLLLNFSDDSGEIGTLGLRFGMTGRLIVGGDAAIERLEYSSGQDNPAWDRFTLTCQCKAGTKGETKDEPVTFRINDPRRLGGVEWNPDTGKLGADLFSFAPAVIAKRVAVGSVPIKARLLDQSRIAGVGNLIADETLWRSGIHPEREAGSLTPADQRRLIKHLRSVSTELMASGGSHTGRLQPSRHRGGVCPKCRKPLHRLDVGGRTSFVCPRHQPLK